MQVVKNKKTGLYALEGMTEGKLLCLQRLLGEAVGPMDTSIAQDIMICVNKGVVANIAHGTQL
jgi:hypothetical protein